MSRKVVILSIIIGLCLTSLTFITGCEDEASATAEKTDAAPACNKDASKCPSDCAKACCEAQKASGQCPVENKQLTQCSKAADAKCPPDCAKACCTATKAAGKCPLEAAKTAACTKTKTECPTEKTVTCTKTE
ncbi:MAG: hypothetical protein ACYS18_04555 [Planctomycetota bacterium]|jgi:hypothetical protein